MPQRVKQDFRPQPPDKSEGKLLHQTIGNKEEKNVLRLYSKVIQIQ